MKQIQEVFKNHYPVFIYLVLSFLIFLMVHWYLNEKSQMLLEDVIEKTEFNTEMLTSVSSNLLESLDLVLLSTSEKINLDKENDHLSYPLERFILRKLIVYPQIKKLTILNNDGSLYWKSYPDDFDDELYRGIINRQIYDSLVFSITSLDMSNQNQILICRASNLMEDEKSKFVIGEIDLSSVFENMSHNIILDSARITLFDNVMNIKLQSDFQEESSDYSLLLDQALENLYDNSSTRIFGGFKTLLSGNQLICFNQLNAFPYYIAIDIDLSVELRDWNRQRGYTAFIFCLGFLIFLAAVIYLDQYRLMTQNNGQAFLDRIRESNERYQKMADEKDLLAKSLAEDIRIRTKSEKALKESEKKFKTLFELSSVGMVLIDFETEKLLEVNNSALCPTGYTKEEILSMDCSQLIPAEYEPARRAITGELRRKGDFIPFEMELIKKSGDQYPVRTRGFQYIGADGRNVIWAIVEDLTQNRRAEKEKQLLQEQLNHKSKMDAIGQISGGIAHDINNILTGIIGATHLLKSEMINPQPEELDYIDIIENSSFRATDITRKLLMFSRKSKMIKKEVDVNAILDDTLGILRSTIDKKITLSYEKNCHSMVIWGDDSALQSSLLNMGINASHAMPDGGFITYSVREITMDEEACSKCAFEITPGPFVEISIKDTGHGISPENISKIFDPFFTTKGPGKGTGLGLSVTMGTVIDHRGTIRVDSAEGRGTTFYLSLPLVADSRDRERPLP